MSMLVHVATSNTVKVRAVRAALGRKARVIAVPAPGGAPARPVSMGQILRGAKSRAKAALQGADLGVGIEAGLFRLEGTYYNVTVAAVTDGRRLSIGGGPFFAMPERFVRAILRGDEELGLHFAGREGGAISAVTGGRVTREEATRLAVLMALAPWRLKGLRVRGLP